MFREGMSPAEEEALGAEKTTEVSPAIKAEMEASRDRMLALMQLIENIEGFNAAGEHDPRDADSKREALVELRKLSLDYFKFPGNIGDEDIKVLGPVANVLNKRNARN